MAFVDESVARQQICEIGRRLYARGFASANGGNISCRIADDRVLCTPSLICKGFMQPDDLCTVDLEGHQVAGHRASTSEVFMHLGVFNARADVGAVVHCHPPHATAFAITDQPIPGGVLPEVEYHLGPVPTVACHLPGTSGLADAVRGVVHQANTVVLTNHGVISWDRTVEEAYWKTEILDAYCQMLILAKSVGPVERLTPEQMAELADRRQRDADAHASH